MNNYHDLLIEDCLACRGPPPVSNARGSEVVDMVQGLVDDLERHESELEALRAEEQFQQNLKADLQDKYDRLDARCKAMDERYEESQAQQQDLQELYDNAVMEGDKLERDFKELADENKSLRIQQSNCKNKVGDLQRKLKKCNKPYWAKSAALLAPDTPKKRARR